MSRCPRRSGGATDRIKVLCVVALAGLLTVAPGPTAADSPQDILVVVNNSLPLDQVSVDDLRDLFLKRRLNWQQGGKAVPIHAPEGSSLRKHFVKRLMGMSVADELTYWQERKIKAGVTPPAEFGNTLKAVFKLKGAVSYVYRSEYKDGVAKVLLVLPG